MGAILSLFGFARDTTKQNIDDIENQISNTSDPVKQEELKNQLSVELQKLDELSAAQNALEKETTNPNSTLNILATEITAANNEIESVLKKRSDNKLKIKELTQAINVLTESKKPIEEEIVMLTSEQITLESRIKELIDSRNKSNDQETINKLAKEETEINNRIIEISMKLSRLNEKLPKIDEEIKSKTNEKIKIENEDGQLAAYEKKLNENLLKLELQHAESSGKESQRKHELEVQIAKLEEEIKLKEEEAKKLCQQATDELIQIELALDNAKTMNTLEELATRIRSNTNCNSEEYQMMCKNLLKTIQSMQSSICEDEIKYLKSITEQIPKAKTIAELESIEQTINNTQACTSDAKTDVVLKLNEAISARKAYIRVILKDEAELDVLYGRFTTEKLTVKEINEIFLKSIAMNGNDSTKIKEMKIKMSEEYNKLLISEIRLATEKCLKIDLTPIDDPKKSIQQNIEDNLLKLQKAHDETKIYITTIEEIYSSLPPNYKLTIDSSEALKPLNNFVKELNELIAAFSDDTMIYNSKLLFALLTCGHGVISADTNESEQNPINILSRTILSHISYKANLMFAELQPILYPIEVSTGPVHQKGNSLTDSFISSYIGCYKEAMNIQEGKILRITKTDTKTNNTIITEEYRIGEDGKSIVGNGKSEAPKHNGTNYYITTPCGPVELININNEVHTKLYQDDFSTELQNVKIYNVEGKLKFNIDGIWFNNDADQTRCSNDEQIEFTKRTIGDGFFITEELDIEIYRTNDANFEYNILRKKTEVSGLRKKLIKYVSNIKNKIGSANCPDYNNLKKSVETFISEKTTDWNSFFKGCRKILDETPDYYWKLMERYTQSHDSYPKVNWYNLPITYRIYSQQDELTAAIAFLMNQVFVTVSGFDELNTRDSVRCYKYINPKSRYSKECYIMNESDKKIFNITDSTIKVATGLTDSATLLSIQIPTSKLIHETEFSNYGTEKKYIKHYFSDATNLAKAFPTIPHITVTNYKIDFVNTMVKKILDHSKNIGTLVKLSATQKLFMNMYDYMDYQEIAETVYYDTIVIALQFDMIFCLNQKKTMMTICHNDAKRGCTQQQTIPMLFAKPKNNEIDPLFDL